MMRDMTERELELERLDLLHAELQALKLEQQREYRAVCAQLLEDARRDVQQHERWYAAGLVTAAELASARRRLLAQRQNIQLANAGKNAHKRLDAVHAVQSGAVVKMV